MQVSVENTSKLERKVRIEVPEEQVNSAISNRLQNMVKTTKVNGFRHGKVPLKVIQGRYGVQIRKEVVGDLVHSSLYEAIAQENLKPAGLPKINDIADESGKALTYTATFEIYPDIHLKPMDGLQFEKPVCTISYPDISKMIDVLRNQRRRLEAVDRVAQINDVVEIDFEGTIEGDVFDGAKADHYQLELGSKSFIEGFEDGLLGRAQGETVLLKLKFPEDYGKLELRGKKVEFKVKINVINESILPEIDAVFMAEFSVKDGNKATFESEIRRNMEREVTATLRRQIKDIVFDKLCEENPIELPQVLVANERDQLQHELEKTLKQQQQVNTMAKADLSLLIERAEKRVSLNLIVTEIIKQNELKADPAKIREMIEQAASGYEDPNAVVNWYYSDQKKLAEVEALALEDTVVEWVLKHAKVTEKACTFNEIMNKEQTLSTRY